MEAIGIRKKCKPGQADFPFSRTRLFLTPKQQLNLDFLVDNHRVGYW